jgi:xanthine/uracil permease
LLIKRILKKFYDFYQGSEKRNMLGNLVGGFIVILVGVNLIPTVANGVVQAQTAPYSNITSSASTILGLTTLFFALAILSSAIAVTAIGLRQAGLLGV